MVIIYAYRCFKRNCKEFNFAFLELHRAAKNTEKMQLLQSNIFVYIMKSGVVVTKCYIFANTTITFYFFYDLLPST